METTIHTAWAPLVRQYLAHCDPAVLREAIAAAQEAEEEVAVLLEALHRQDFETVARLAVPLAASLDRRGHDEAAWTVALLHVDRVAQLVEDYNQFPLVQQLQILHDGLEACEATIHLANLCRDLPCVAIYLALKGTGLYYKCDLRGAQKSYAEALRLYRRLAKVQPQVYEPAL